MTSDQDLIRQLNIGLALSDPPEPYAAFGNTFRTVFDFKPSSSEYLDKPQAEKLASMALEVLISFVKLFRDIRDASESTAEKIQILSTINLDTTSREQTLGLTTRIKNDYLSAFDSIQLIGAGKLQVMHAKIIEFRDNKIAPKLHELGARVDEQRSRQERIQTGEELLQEVEAAQFGDSQSLSALVTNLASRVLVKLTIKKATGNLENRMAAIQRRIDADLAEIEDIKHIDLQSETVQDRIEDCSSLWNCMHARLWRIPTRVITKELPTHQLEPRMKDVISTVLTELHTVLVQLMGQMDEILDEVDSTLGSVRAMTHVVEEFDKSIQDISVIFNQLMSMCNIVREHHSGPLLDNIRTLTKHCLTRFKEIQAVFTQWVSYVESNSTSPLTFAADIWKMADGALPFLTDYVSLQTKIQNTLSEEFCTRRSSRVLETLKEGWRPKTISTKTPPVATLGQALEVLNRLESVVKTMGIFSVQLSTGLLRYERRPQGGTSTSGGSGGSGPDPFVNPFVIDASIARKTSHVLNREIIRLDFLANAPESKPVPSA